MTIPKHLRLLFFALSYFATQTAQAYSSLAWQSLQDTSTYASSQQNVGISVAIPIAGSGSVSGNYSKTNINSQYASVNEQTGIQAGDGGYAVNVTGDTTLVGGVIAASDKAIADNKLAFVSDGKVTQSDIQNQADYTANAVSVSAGVGGQVSASGGTGSDSGHASSITHSGIGISTKADSTGAIKPIFNAAKVNANLNAQVQITQSFSQQAPKAVADFAASQAVAFRKAGNEAEAKKWDEGGAYRVILHTVSGALSGGTNGAAGALTTASAAPLLDDLQAKTQSALQSLGIPPEKAKSLSQGLAELTSAGMGAAAGGVQGATTGLTVDTNNRQLHPTELAWINANAKKYADKRGGISEAQAKAELAQQALKNADAAWQSYLGTDTNLAAQNFLNSAQGSYSNQAGNGQALFSNVAGDFSNGLINANNIKADPNNLAFYQQYVQPSKQNSSLTGTALMGANQVKQLPDVLVNGLITLASTNPLTTGKAIVTGMYDGVIGAGTGLGGSAAAYTDPATQAMLNSIYGDANASNLVATFALLPAVGMVGGAAANGVVKAVKNEVVITSDGTANAATVSGLKAQLANENLVNIANQDPRLAAAVKGDVGMGSATAADAEQLGNAWVGDGAALAKNQATCPGCLWSADKTRFYRPPSEKPNTPAQFNPTGVQANFEQWSNGKKTSNSHLVVTP